MNTPKFPIRTVLVLFAVLAATGTSAFAQDRTVDPSVSEENLALLVQPLSKADLSSTAASWFGMVQAKVQAITNERIKDGGGDTGTIAALEGERNALVTRFWVVLTAWKAKGGDTAEYDAYLAAVIPKRKSSILPPGPPDAAMLGKLASKAWNWLKSPDGGIALGLKILAFIGVLFAFRILANFLAKVTRKATSKMKKTSELLRDFFVNTVRKLVFFIGLIMALSVLGVNIGPFLAAIGAIGFIIGFALQGTLSNFACGIMILLYRPYDLGNVVTVAGVTGKVSAMSLVSTTIKTPDNQIVIVPNSSIWGDVITNVTGSDTRRVDMVMGIGYGDDIAKAQSVIERILAGHDKILSDPAPVVKVHELADSSVNFVVRPWANTSDYWDVYWDVTRQVKERFDEEGISIPFPQQDVYMHQVAAD